MVDPTLKSALEKLTCEASVKIIMDMIDGANRFGDSMAFVAQELSRECLLLQLSVVRKVYSISRDLDSEWLRTTGERLLPVLVGLLTASIDLCLSIFVCYLPFLCSFGVFLIALTN